MLVKVELMNMSSDPQYVSSSGWTSARLVNAEDATKCGGDGKALYDLEGKRVTAEMLQDVETRHTKNGACNYEYHTGTFDIPDGMALVQKHHLNICTRDKPVYQAWVVNQGSLKALYEQRAAEYTKLAAVL